MLLCAWIDIQRHSILPVTAGPSHVVGGGKAHMVLAAVPFEGCQPGWQDTSDRLICNRWTMLWAREILGQPSWGIDFSSLHEAASHQRLYSLHNVIFST